MHHLCRALSLSLLNTQTDTHIHHTHSLSVCLPVCLSVYLSVCLPVCLSTCLSVCLSVCLSTCLSVCPILTKSESVVRGVHIIVPFDVPVKAIKSCEYVTAKYSSLQ